MNFPSHKAGLYLTHNQHKDYYETVEEHINEYANMSKNDFVSPEDYQRCVDTNELWELQWYPDTPIGFHKVLGSSLEVVMVRAMEIDAELKGRQHG
jgi:hypothetical protein